MRSRYTACTLGEDAYLYATCHASIRPAAGGITADDDDMKWLGLEICQHQPMDNEAMVEFVALYKIGGRAQHLHEIS